MKIFFFSLFIIVLLWFAQFYFNIFLKPSFLSKDLVVINSEQVSDTNTLNEIKKIPYGRWIWVWSISNKNKIWNKPSWQLLYDQQKHQDILLQFLIQQKITKVFLYVGAIQREDEKYFSKGKFYNEDWLYNLLKIMHENNIKPYALYYINDDVNNIQDYKKVWNLVNTVLKWNITYPDATFIWIQNDQEVNNTSIYNDYLNMLSYINEITKNTSLIHSIAAKPIWINQSINTENFLLQISKVCDEIFFMDYSDTERIIKSLWTRVFDLVGIYINIWIETWSINAMNNETFFEEIQKNWISWFYTNVEDYYEKYFSGYVNFKWLSIHDYNQYFQHVYKIEPYKFDIKNFKY